MEQAIEERWIKDGGGKFKLIPGNSQTGEGEEDSYELADRLGDQSSYSPVREVVEQVVALEEPSGYNASPETEDGEMSAVIRAPEPPARNLKRVVSAATEMYLQQEENPFL